MQFTRKGYGRIYVHDISRIEDVKDIIKQMDEYEFSYMPKEMIAPFSKYPEVIYTHKFDVLNLDALSAICASRGIFIFCFDSCYNEYPTDEVFKFEDTPKTESIL